MSERALEGERTMSKMIPENVGTYNNGTNLWDYNNGWESRSAQPGILYYESYFDFFKIVFGHFWAHLFFWIFCYHLAKSYKNAYLAKINK